MNQPAARVRRGLVGAATPLQDISHGVGGNAVKDRRDALAGHWSHGCHLPSAFVRPTRALAAGAKELALT